MNEGQDLRFALPAFEEQEEGWLWDATVKALDARELRGFIEELKVPTLTSATKLCLYQFPMSLVSGGRPRLADRRTAELLELSDNDRWGQPPIAFFHGYQL